jgi:hypothetical protein
MNKKYDVIVAGGGTAGVAATVAAARGGAKTLVIERFGHLGGIAAYGIPFLGIISANGVVVNHGVMSEIIERLKKEGACFGYATGAYWNTPENPNEYGFSLTPYDPEYYKYVAQEMVLEAGADILFYSYITDVSMENSQIKAVQVANKSGMQTYEADVFIDCTGDADLAYLAGGDFIENEFKQNCSMLFRIGGVDLEQLLEDLKEGKTVQGWGSWHTRIIKEAKTEGADPTLVHLAGHLVPVEGEPEITFTAVSFRDGEISLNATRSVGFSGVDAEDVTQAEISERRNVMRLFKLIKQNIPAFRKSELLSTAPVGFRETRNIIGDYTMTREDVLGAKDFADGVARGAYPIDIHDPKGGRTSFQFIKDGGSYSIPYRCFLPKGIEGLLVAGKNISVTHDANGTTRIMGCVVSQGEAAGTAAALAVKNKVTPRQVDVDELRSKLPLYGE